MIKYNFTAGLLTNQGSGGSKYDLVAYGRIPTYDSIKGCFSVGDTPANAYLRTNVVADGDNTLFYKDMIYLRIICDITALDGTIWGTEINNAAVPIRASADTNNIYIGGNDSIPNNGIIIAGRNDLIFKINTITGSFEIKNKTNGKSGCGTGTSILKANMNGRNLYLGCANYSGSANQPMSNIDLYTVYFGYDEGAVTADYVCYLKKGETYYSFDNTTGSITAIGNKITFEMLSSATTKNKLPADIVNITGYDVVIFNTEEFSTSTNLQLVCHDVKTEVYVSDVDANTFLDKDGELANVGSSYGIDLASYNIDADKDVILRIPETSRLKIHQDFLNTGNDFVSEENTVGPDIGVRGYVGVKNMAIYGHAKTDSISVSKEIPLQPTFTGLVEKSNVLILGEIPIKSRIENSKVEVTGTRAIDGIDSAMKVSYDVYSSLVEIAEDEDMFNDSYVIDGSGTGVSNITVNVGNFIEIKLPDDITDVIYPEFMSYHLSKLKGIPQKSGIYIIRFKLDGKEVTSKLTVVGVTRIK